MNIILIGFTSTGKSSVGKALAKLSNYSFYDLDHEIENEHNKRTGKIETYRNIFKNYGEEYFAECEYDALNRLIVHEKTVIATGGHAALEDKCRDLMKNHTKVVHLTATPAIIFERMKVKGFPLYLGSNPTIDKLEDIFIFRKPVYESLAQFELDVGNLTIQEAASALYNKLFT